MAKKDYRKGYEIETVPMPIHTADDLEGYLAVERKTASQLVAEGWPEAAEEFDEAKHEAALIDEIASADETGQDHPASAIVDENGSTMADVGTQDHPVEGEVTTDEYVQVAASAAPMGSGQVLFEVRDYTGMSNGFASVRFVHEQCGIPLELIHRFGKTYPEQAEHQGAEDEIVDRVHLAGVVEYARQTSLEKGFREGTIKGLSDGMAEAFAQQEAGLEEMVPLEYAARIVGVQPEEMYRLIEQAGKALEMAVERGEDWYDGEDAVPGPIEAVHLPKLIAHLTGSMISQAVAQQAESLTRDHRRAAAEVRQQAVADALEDQRAQALNIALNGWAGTTPGERLMMALAISGKLPDWIAVDARLAPHHVRMAVDTVEAVAFADAAVWSMLAQALGVDVAALVGDETGGIVRTPAVRQEAADEEGM